MQGEESGDHMSMLAPPHSIAISIGLQLGEGDCLLQSISFVFMKGPCEFWKLGNGSVCVLDPNVPHVFAFTHSEFQDTQSFRAFHTNKPGVHANSCHWVVESRVALHPSGESDRSPHQLEGALCLAVRSTPNPPRLPAERSWSTSLCHGP